MQEIKNGIDRTHLNSKRDCGLFLTNLRFRPAVSATVEKAPAGFKDFIKHLILDFSCLEIFGLLRFTPFLLRGFAVPVKKL